MSMQAPLERFRTHARADRQMERAMESSRSVPLGRRKPRLALVAPQDYRAVLVCRIDRIPGRALLDNGRSRDNS